MSEAGRKDDKEKPDWSLMPFKVLTEVVKVLTFGKRKYERNNWKHVNDARNRYFAAAQRHLTEWQSGELIDEESGLHHLAHACCCLIFLMWFDDED